MKFSKSESGSVSALLEKLSLSWVRDKNLGLYTGASGILVARYEIRRQNGNLELLDEISSGQTRLVRGLENGIGNSTLSSGYPGILWALRHTRHRTDKDLLAFYQELTKEILQDTDWTGDYELARGLCGIGTYLVDRKSEHGARENLELLLKKLEQASSVKDGLRAWYTPREKVPSLSSSKHGQYNLGLAHGLPAVWVMLARLHHVTIARSRTKKLFSESVEWFLKSAERDGDGLPSHVDSFKRSPPARLGWCYGDPGAGLALLLAAEVFQSNRAFNAAKKILLRAVVRSEEQDPISVGIHDAGLCHGSAGLALQFYYAYRITRDVVFLKASKRWFHDTLSRRVGASRGFFEAYDFDHQKSAFRSLKNQQLLVGSAGVALALATLNGEKSSSWGRCMDLQI